MTFNIGNYIREPGENEELPWFSDSDSDYDEEYIYREPVIPSFSLTEGLGYYASPIDKDCWSSFKQFELKPTISIANIKYKCSDDILTDKCLGKASSIDIEYFYKGDIAIINRLLFITLRILRQNKLLVSFSLKDLYSDGKYICIELPKTDSLESYKNMLTNVINIIYHNLKQISPITSHTGHFAEYIDAAQSYLINKFHVYEYDEPFYGTYLD